jgi:hypothetical protein
MHLVNVFLISYQYPADPLTTLRVHRITSKNSLMITVDCFGPIPRIAKLAPFGQTLLTRFLLVLVREGSSARDQTGITSTLVFFGRL